MMNPSAAPIIFVHYGPACYLRWALQAARRMNPQKRIILLGDESNRRFARGVAEFFLFEEYAKGEALKKFEEVFQVIQGARHHFHKTGGIEAWLKFIFRRWFLMAEFIKSQNINAFWTFDSDTLLLESLDKVESRFAGVDATTQCRGECLNGWIGSVSLVERYIACINELFNDPDYLQSQRERLVTHAGLAFNEMDAFKEFCRRKNIKTCRAAHVVHGEAFDDALAIADEYESVFKKESVRNYMKRLWISPNGKLYIRKIADQKMVRLLSCNMSWMPDFFWKRLLRLTKPSSRKIGEISQALQHDLKEHNLKEIDLSFPWTMKIKKMLSIS